MQRLTYAFVNDVFRGPVYGSHDIFTSASFADFVRRHDVDRSRAIFARDDGKTIGAIAFAQRGERAWLSVMGVLPAYRRRGYGRQLFGQAVDAVRSSGATHIEFEVIQRNEHARRMYESFGFHIVRELDVWARDARSATGSIRAKRHSLAAVQRVAGAVSTCWQRDSLAVERAGASALVQHDDAYAYVRIRNESAVLLDAGARDEGSAGGLAAKLDDVVPYDITLLNEPFGSPLARALERAGWRIVERQWQMKDAPAEARRN